MPLTFQLLENEGLASSCRCRKATSRSTEKSGFPCPTGSHSSSCPTLHVAPTGTSSERELGSGYDYPCMDRDGRSDIC